MSKKTKAQNELGSHDQKLNNLSSRIKAGPKKSGKSQSLPPKRKGKTPRPSRINS